MGTGERKNAGSGGAGFTSHAAWWRGVRLAASAASLCAACGLEVPSLDSPELNPSDAQVKATLHEVFPELTEEELDAYAARLDVDAVVTLKLEMAGIRDVASALSAALKRQAVDAVERRRKDLEPYDAGFPQALEPVGRAAFYDATRGEARVELSGVFADRTAVELSSSDVTLTIGGAVEPTLAGLGPVKIDGHEASSRRNRAPFRVSTSVKEVPSAEVPTIWDTRYGESFLDTHMVARAVGSRDSGPGGAGMGRVQR
jgi:hypothetical protein